MHEYSQTAPAIDWRAFPYMYAAADSTPLFLLATLDYVRASGDTQFLKDNRDAIEKAWAFETSHADTNGIYDNRQGTGWVESWPGGMPHQEIYLALLDQQASAAMAQMESLLGDTAKSQAAKSRAEDDRRNHQSSSSTTATRAATPSAATPTARSTALPRSIPRWPGGRILPGTDR